MYRGRFTSLAPRAARALGAAAVVCWLSLGPRPAAAAGDPADAAISEGLQLRRAGRDEEALARFTKAYEVSKSPRALAQIGFAEQALGRWVDAEAHLDAANSSKDPWIRKFSAAIARSLDTIRGHLGSLDVLGGPEGAEVRVDGRLIGALPLPRPARVAAGDVAVEVSHPGYKTISRTTNVASGQLARETVTLVPLPPPQSDEPVAPSLASKEAAPRLVGTAPAPAAVQPRSPWIGRAAWITAGVGAVGLGVGAFEWYLKERDYQRFNSTSGCDANLPSAGGGDCPTLLHDGDQAKTFAFVAFVAAGTLVAASTVLFVLSANQSSSSPAAETAALRCLPAASPSMLGGGCALRF